MEDQDSAGLHTFSRGWACQSVQKDSGWKKILHTISPPLHMAACPWLAVSQSLWFPFSYDFLLSRPALVYSLTGNHSLLVMWFSIMCSLRYTGYSKSKGRQFDLLMFWTAGSNPTPHCFWKALLSLPFLQLLRPLLTPDCRSSSL